MSSAAKVTIGRSAGADVVLEGPTVSARHALLRWHEGRLVLADLGSANGTYVDGQRIAGPTHVEIGHDVRLGSEVLAWDEPRLRAFLRHGASDTIVAMPRFGRYQCPKCQKQGLLPPGFKQGELACTHCGAELLFGGGARRGGTLGSVLVGVLLAFALVAAFVALRSPAGVALVRGGAAEAGGGGAGAPSGADLLAPLVPDRLRIAASRTAAGPSPEESAIRDSGTAARVMDAMDSSDATTRNLAVQLASVAEGPFHVEQVAAIWLHVRAEFDYVNDPRGHEYFARASETIANGFAGDCDDFATTLAGMVGAIGGRARVVMMDGPGGGHAYAEACIDAAPEEIAPRLRAFVRRHWDRRLGRAPSVTRIHHRADAGCRVWLNLDWNANYPAGPYAEERWAVSIEADGATETLAPYVPPR